MTKEVFEPNIVTTTQNRRVVKEEEIFSAVLNFRLVFHSLTSTAKVTYKKFHYLLWVHQQLKQKFHQICLLGEFKKWCHNFCVYGFLKSNVTIYKKLNLKKLNIHVISRLTLMRRYKSIFHENWSIFSTQLCILDFYA